LTLAPTEDAGVLYLRERRWFATLTVNLSTIGSIMASTMVNVALPDIMGTFGIGQDTAHWMSTGFLSAQCVCLLLNAWLVSRIGPRRTYMLAIVIFVAASLVGQTGANIATVILARVLQGCAAGLLQPLALMVVYAAFPPHQRGVGIGIFGMGIVLGPALGPVIGGLIVDHFAWQYTFIGSLPVCILGGVLALSTLPDRLGTVARRPFNWVSFALIVFAITLGLTSASNGQRLGWNDPSVVLGLVGALLAFLAFIIWEMVTASPLLQVRLFANKAFAISSCVGFIFGAGMFSSLYILPLYAQTVQDYTATKSGLMLMPAGLILLAVFPIAGRLAQRSSRGPIIAGLTCFALSNFMLAQGDVNSAFWTVAILVAVGRVGLGLIMPALNLQGLRTLPADLLPFGAGTLNFVRMMGAACGVNAVSLVLDRGLDRHFDLLRATQTEANAMTQEFMLRMNHYLDAAGLAGPERLAATSGYLRRIIEQQANAFAHQDGFWFIGTLFLLAVVPALFLGQRGSEEGQRPVPAAPVPARS
jgi:MFS transporter, DHA2 family, multidrug resistance protein